MKINDNVYFAKRPALKGKIVEIMPNGIIKVNFTDEDGILVKKGKMKKFEVGADDLIKYAKGSTIEGYTSSNYGYLSSMNGRSLFSYDKRDYTINIDLKNFEIDVNIRGNDSVSQSALNDTDAEWEQHSWGYLIYPKSIEQVSLVLKALKVKHTKDELKNAFKPKYAKGSTVKGNYFSELEANFSSTRRGGVKNYSVDIDLENGEQLRGGDLDFKDGNDALFLYERVKQKGEYQHEKIEDIQLIVNFKSGDYETVDIPTYAKGSTVEGELYRLYDVQDDNFKEIIGSLSQINDFLDEQGENGNYDKWIEGATFSNADKYGLYLEKIGKYAKGGIMSSGFNYSIGGL